MSEAEAPPGTPQPGGAHRPAGNTQPAGAPGVADAAPPGARPQWLPWSGVRHALSAAALDRLGSAQRCALAALMGALASLAFAPLHWVPLVVPALVTLYRLSVRAPSRTAALAAGWWFGFGHFFVGLVWIAVAFQYQANMPASLGLVAVALLAGVMAGYIALVSLVCRWTGWRGMAGIMLFAALWGIGEALRGTLFTGFPWNPLATVWVGWQHEIAQGAAWLGTYGWSVVTALLALVPALPGEPGTVRRRTAWLGLAGGCAALFAAGHLWLAAGPSSTGPGVPVHLVQANIGQDVKWDETLAREILHIHLDLSRAALRERGPGVVIWPETAVPNLIEEEPSTRFLIRRMLDGRGVLITGGLRVDRLEDGTPVSARNSLLVVDGRGTVTHTYDKSHLVPFGEYLPARPLLEALGLSRLAPGGMDFLAGPGPRTLDIAGVPAVGPLICYEAIFSGAAVEPGTRPRWLLNISNDAWFGQSTGPPQHLAQAQLRAIEEGLPMIRATPTGLTAIIDANGRLLQQLPAFTRGVLSGDLPEPRDATPFALFGHKPAALFVLLLVLGAGLWHRTFGRRALMPALHSA